MVERKSIAELNVERARKRQENLRKVKVGPPIRRQREKEEEKAAENAREEVRQRISFDE